MASWTRCIPFSLWSISLSFLTQILTAQAALQPASFPANAIARSGPVRLPVTFEMNRGQSPTAVLAIAKTAAGPIDLSRNEITLPGPTTRSGFHLRFRPAARGNLVPEDPSGGVTNYIQGRDPSSWLQGLPLYRRLRYPAIAPGVDLVFHGQQGRLEYDFEIAPGASLAAAQLSLDDATTTQLQPNGSLQLSHAAGDSIQLLTPVAYQLKAGARQPVQVSFALHDRTIGFNLGSYDPQLPLIIDPVVAYTAIIPGPSSVLGMGLDNAGDVIIAGTTFRANGASVYDDEVYGIKLDPTGSTILYSTYIDSGESGNVELAVDSTGNAYIAGMMGVINFPLTSQNLGVCSFACYDGFVVKLDSTGKVVYSTLTGTGTQMPKDIAVDAAGEAYIVGSTSSSGLKTVNAYQGTPGGGFFAKLNSAGTDYVFSSYFGVSGASGTVPTSIALDSSGNFYIAGTGTQVPLMRPLEVNTGATFISKFSADGKTLLFSTDLGAVSIAGLQTASDGTLYVAGDATADLPYSSNTIAPLIGPNSTFMFAAAINPAETGFTYATYLGAGYVYATALGPDGNFYVGGSAYPPIPLQNAVDSDISIGGYFLSLNPSGQLVSSSMFGGHVEEQTPTALAVDMAGNIYLASIPTPNPAKGTALDPVNVGAGNAYGAQSLLGSDATFTHYAASIVKIAPANQPQVSLSLIQPLMTLRNAGSADLHISSITFSGTLQKQWGNCGSTIPAGTSCILTIGDSSGNEGSGSLTINSDAVPAQQAYIPAGGTNTQVIPIGAYFWVEDANLNFAPQMVGTVSAVQSFKIWNVGSITGTLDTVRANGASGIQVTHNCGALAPGSYCTVQVQAAPTASFSGGGGILIQSSSGQVSDDTPSATAITSQDPIYFSLSSISFGTVLVGQTSLPHVFTVTNATNSPLTVPTPMVQGSTFSIAGTNCAVPLQPQKACSFSVVYSPTAPAPNSFTLDTGTISFTGGSYPITLGGQGVAPAQVTVTPASLNFGAVTGAGSAILSVTLTNAGSAAVPIASVRNSNPSFSVQNNCGISVASQQSCSISVTVNGGEFVGPQSDTIYIALNYGLTAIAVPLSAIGAPLFSASPASIDFGNTTFVGTKSTAQTINITNISGAPIGASPYLESYFKILSQNCPNPIPDRQSCSVSIDFEPVLSGQQSDSFAMIGSNGTSLLLVPLTATALPAPPIVAFTPQTGASTTVTVSSGQTATYHLVATASPLFSGKVLFYCSGAPIYSNCGVSPSTMTLAPGQQVNISVFATTNGTIANTASAIAAQHLTGEGAGAIFAAFILFFSRKKLTRAPWISAAILISAVLVSGVVACGGGGANGVTGPIPTNTAPGTYTLDVYASIGVTQSTDPTLPLTLIVK
jgi:hypothetical protein